MSLESFLGPSDHRGKYYLWMPPSCIKIKSFCINLLRVYLEQAFLLMAKEVMRKYKGEFDRIHLARADSDGEEYVSELSRRNSPSESCCT